MVDVSVNVLRFEIKVLLVSTRFVPQDDITPNICCFLSVNVTYTYFYQNVPSWLRISSSLQKRTPNKPPPNVAFSHFFSPLSSNFCHASVNFHDNGATWEESQRVGSTSVGLQQTRRCFLRIQKRGDFTSLTESRVRSFSLPSAHEIYSYTVTELTDNHITLTPPPPHTHTHVQRSSLSYMR